MRAIAFVVLSLVLLATAALAEVPGQMNYQGTLTDSNGVAVDDTVSITFAIYTDPEGGAPLWAETQGSVIVRQGIFNVLLGAGNLLPDSLFREPNRWLGISLFDDPEMQPRQQITTVGYAFRAAEADTADHVRGGGAGSDGDWTIVGNDMYSSVSGRVGIGTVGPQEKFHVADGNLIVGGLGVNNRIKATSGDASIVAELFAYDGLGGYVGTFTNHNLVLRTNDLDRMTLDTGGNVGIGATNPAAKLEIEGAPGAVAIAKIDQTGARNWTGWRLDRGDNSKWLIGMSDVDDKLLFRRTMSSTDMVIDTTGYVGIGTTDPKRALHVSSDMSSFGMVTIERASATAGEASIGFKERNDAGGDSTWVVGVGGWGNTSDFVFGRGGPKFLITPDADVGIGTNNPETRLHVKGTDWPTYVTIDAYGGYAPGVQLNVSGSNEWTMFYHPVDSMVSFFRQGEGDRMVIKNNGNVGIGTSYPGSARLAVMGGDVGIGTYSPSQKLDVDYGNLIVQGTSSCDSTGEEGIVYLGTVHHYIKGVYGFGVKIGTYAVGDVISIKELTGRVGIGTTSPDERLHVNGTVKCDVLKLTGGADIVEPFDVSGTEEMKPGMVMTIDQQHSGKLKISEKAYDRCVAGIISGAGSIEPGLVMGQSESVAGGEYPVALTGRVYCWADASYGAIQTGDLLTTSNTPGHAMKVTDYARAQGAVIGKAMSPLEKGKDLVLVLVSLQ